MDQIGKSDCNDYQRSKTQAVSISDVYNTKRDSDREQSSRLSENQSAESQVLTSEGGDGGLSLGGQVNIACNKSASNDSDYTNSAKPPDFDTRRGSRDIATASEPRSAVTNKPPFKFAGIVISMLGSLCFCTSVLCIKMLPENSPHGLREKLRAIFVRGTILMICCGISLCIQRGSIKVPRDEIWINVARALLGCFGVIGAYLALCFISLGDRAAIVFSSPIWTSLLSHFILGEPFSWILLFTLPCSIIGIIMIAHPALILDLFIPSNLATTPMLAEASPTNYTDSALEIALGDIDDVIPSNLADDIDGAGTKRWIGVCMALTTSLSISCVYIVLKYRKTTKIQTTTFWLGFAICVEGFIASCIVGFGDFPSLKEVGLLLVNGFLSWIGQTCMQWGLLYEKASILSVVRTSEVAISFILSALFLDDKISWTSVLGATIIVSVVILLIINNWLSNKPDGQEVTSKALERKQ